MPSKRGPRERPAPSADAGQSNAGRSEYDLMLLVERYESLAEDMEELGVATLDEVRQKITALHRRLDAQER